MTAKLQALIDSAQQLTPVEQVELINALSRFLDQNYHQESSITDFWQTKSTEQIIASQKIPPASDISALKADFWPNDESADDFIEFVQQQRQEDCLDN